MRHRDDVERDDCVCGERIRLLTAADTNLANFHVTHIVDSEKHYHQRCTEIYYVLEGSGVMELDDAEVAVVPGLLILVPPGVAHRGRGDFTSVIVGVPAREEEDEVVV